MPYVRHTIVSMDLGKKDAMVSHLTGQLDMVQSTQGLTGIRVVQVAEDRMVVSAVYEDKGSADAAAAKANGVRDSAAEFVTEEPVVREEEVTGRRQGKFSHAGVCSSHCYRLRPF